MKFRMYCCDTCNFTQYHSLRYCPKCPGKLKLVVKEIEHPSSFKTEQDIHDYLKSRGLEYYGEYPKFHK